MRLFAAVVSDYFVLEGSSGQNCIRTLKEVVIEGGTMVAVCF
jgi:hypothetical protein